MFFFISSTLPLLEYSSEFSLNALAYSFLNLPLPLPTLLTKASTCHLHTCFSRSYKSLMLKINLIDIYLLILSIKKYNFKYKIIFFL